MLTFFNTKNDIKSLIQLTNYLALTVAIYNGLTNSQSTLSEVGLDVMLHAWTISGLNDQPDVFLQMGASGGNLFRLGVLFHGLTTNSSCAPFEYNILDFLLHSVNTVACLIPDDLEDKPKPN